MVGYSDFIPALIEKMRLQLALQDWDQALETAHRYKFTSRPKVEEGLAEFDILREARIKFKLLWLLLQGNNFMTALLGLTKLKSLP